MNLLGWQQAIPKIKIYWMYLTLCESEVEGAVQYTINGIAAITSFYDSLKYIVFLFSEWPLYPNIWDLA